MPISAEDAMSKAVEQSVPAYERYFGSSAPSGARVFLSYDPERSSYLSGAANGATVFMQLRGPSANVTEQTLCI